MDLGRFALIAACLIPFPTFADLTFVHTDHLGNPVAYTNGNGEVIGREYYTSYGESLNPPTTDDTVSFTGHYRDGDTGLIYMQARYYDPEIARFLSVDPVTFSPEKPEHFNRFWYASANPLVNVDPDGREVAGILLDNDVKQLIGGEINKQEYKERLDARGKGAALAISAIGTAASATSASIAVTRVMIGRGSVEAMVTTAEIAGASEALNEGIEAMTEISETGSLQIEPTDVAAIGTALLPGGKAGLQLTAQAASVGAHAVEHYQEETKEAETETKRKDDLER